jgi:hypothetical protein
MSAIQEKEYHPSFGNPSVRKTPLNTLKNIPNHIFFEHLSLN